MKRTQELTLDLAQGTPKPVTNTDRVPRAMAGRQKKNRIEGRLKLEKRETQKAR